ncbi:META domain-containing protein [Chloroflexota bacterium]
MSRPLLCLAALLLAVFAIFAGACGQTESKEIEDIKWILVSYGEPGNLTTVIAGTEITATFDSTYSQIRGSAGCNSYSGDYESNNSDLAIRQIAYTEMACLNPAGIMEQEQKYLDVLMDAESYQVEDETLQINCDGEILIYTAG